MSVGKKSDRVGQGRRENGAAYKALDITLFPADNRA